MKTSFLCLASHNVQYLRESVSELRIRTLSMVERECDVVERRIFGLRFVVFVQSTKEVIFNVFSL